MTLHGLDISHWQSGLQLAKTGKDFAIMKATDGTSYVDATCDGFVNQAKAAGMLWGVYHFAQNTGNMTAEADHFIASTRGYQGHGILVLDWEHGDLGNVSGAKAFLDRVYDKTGVRPLIYMSQSVAAGHNWSSVAKDYALWVARYGSSYGSTGAWGSPAMWQYTSSGRVSGYGENVDLDHFYGDRTAWGAFATGETSGDNGGGDNGDGGDDEMPQWKNMAYGVDHTFPADGEWHVLTIGQADDGGIQYSFLAGPKRVTGVLNVSLTGLANGHEVDLRPIFVEAKKGEDTKLVQQFPATEFFAASGTTQIGIPFAQDIIKGSDGWDRRLRFQIRAYGGEKVTIISTRARGLWWDR